VVVGVVVRVICVLARRGGSCCEGLGIVQARTLMRELMFLVMLQLHLSSNNSNHARRLHISSLSVFKCVSWPVRIPANG